MQCPNMNINIFEDVFYLKPTFKNGGTYLLKFITLVYTLD